MMNKITNLTSLQAEKIKLQLDCKKREAELNNKLEYLHENMGAVLLATLIPHKKNHNTGNGFLSGFINGFVPALSKIASSPTTQQLIKVAMSTIAAAVIGRFFKK